MNLSRLFRTIFLVEFIFGLYLAIKELFRKSKTINYPFEKGSISPRMSGKIVFKIYAEERQSQAVLTILDNGPGIPENRLEAIFQRFYSERPKGESFGDHSGLGLSIARQIVIGHGGSLLASNRDSGGARFTLILPLS